MLRETGRLARAAGWGSLGLVAIDGTKVRANTSRHKAMSHGRRVAEAARLERECAAIVARMGGSDRRGGQPAAAARLRGGVRLTRAGEAAPPAREAE